MDDAERARGARLLARLPWAKEHGTWTYAPWLLEDGRARRDIGTVRGADGGNVAAVYPGRDLAIWDADEARSVVWLVNHAGELLRESAELAGALAELDAARAEVARLTAERDRYLEALQWYAAAEPWQVDCDGGSKAWDVLHDTGQEDAIRAARAAIEAAGDDVLP